VPDLGVPIPLRVEGKVLADVAPQLDPLTFKLSGAVVKPHGHEYTGFGRDAPRFDFFRERDSSGS
jgi:hypothetical protein